MWFEITFIASAGMILMHMPIAKYALGNTIKQYVFMCTVIPVFYLLATQKTFPLTIVLDSCIFAAVYLIFCCILKKAGGLKRKKIFLMKTVLSAVLYICVFSNSSAVQDMEQTGREFVRYIFAVLTFCFLFSGRIKVWMEKRKIYKCFSILAAAIPVWSFYIIECVNNEILDEMAVSYAAGNIILLSFLFAALYFMFPEKKIAAALFLSLSLLFGIANYYVLYFRGSPVMPVDLLSVRTAVQVVGGYEFQITRQMLNGILHWYAGVTMLCCFPQKHADTGWKLRAAAVIFCIYEFCFMNIAYICNTGINQWNINDTYTHKGSLMGFTLLLRQLQVKEPEGYSSQKAEHILAEYEPKEPNGPKEEEPVVIAIMDESFCDLRVLGDFDCSEEFLKNWYQTEDFIYKGQLYTSVYGGGTANTEFEFLTGSSMANCPAGAVPYQLYHFKSVENLANILGQFGYETTAVHPEQKGNWNRMRVYSDLGFQDFLGFDDFEDPGFVRNFVSDASSFQKVRKIFEDGYGRKQFIFNVTMQNHGGYYLGDMAGYSLVSLKDEWHKYSDVEIFMTLIKESDQALQELLEYFRNVDEHVILCIFGDHQPGVNAEWVEELMGKETEDFTLEETERKYAVPYMIWANYDTAVSSCIMDTSANYLGSLLLECAGIQGTSYTNFLLKMRDEIPVFNVFGYQTKDGNWHAFDNEENPHWIEDYRILQYYTMFDSNLTTGNVQERRTG